MHCDANHYLSVGETRQLMPRGLSQSYSSQQLCLNCYLLLLLSITRCALTTPDTNAVSIYTNQRAETLLPRLELRGEKEKPILGNCFRTSTRCSMAPLIWKELGEQNHSWLYETAARPGLRKKQTSVSFLFFWFFFPLKKQTQHWGGNEMRKGFIVHTPQLLGSWHSSRYSSASSPEPWNSLYHILYKVELC